MTSRGPFSIVLGGEVAGSASCPEGHLAGRIRIGTFVEGFCASLSHWTPADYRAQWRRALGAVVAADGSRSALITDALDPATAGFLTWWPLYRVGERVRIANGLVPTELYDLARVLEDPAPLVPPPEDVWGGPPEERASEWTTDVAAIRHFLTPRPRSPGP